MKKQKMWLKKPRRDSFNQVKAKRKKMGQAIARGILMTLGVEI